MKKTSKSRRLITLILSKARIIRPGTKGMTIKEFLACQKRHGVVDCQLDKCPNWKHCKYFGHR